MLSYKSSLSLFHFFHLLYYVWVVDLVGCVCVCVRACMHKCVCVLLTCYCVLLTCVCVCVNIYFAHTGKLLV